MSDRPSTPTEYERMMRAAANAMFEVASREFDGYTYEAMRVTNDYGDLLLEVYPSVGEPIRLWVTAAFVRNEGDNLRVWLERKVGEIREAIA